MDDLDRVVEANTQRRMESVGYVEAIIKSKVDEFYQTLAKRSLYSKTSTLERVSL